MGVGLRPLGHSGLWLSRLGLGTVKFGRNTDVKYPDAFELPTDIEVVSLLQEAARLGVNYLDTAPAYGKSEERLGELLADVGASFQIVTKVGEFYEKGRGSRYDFSPPAVEASIEQSLTRLKREHLDVVLLHSDGDDCRHLDGGALKTLIGLKAQGLIRAVGLSGKTVAGGRQALAEGADALMITLNPTATAEWPLVAEAHASGAGVLVKKALGSGHLTQSIEQILSQLFAHPGITSAVIGTLNPDHLRHNCQALPTENHDDTERH